MSLRSLVDRVTPIEIAAIQKGIAVLAPLTGTSVTADQILADAGSFEPGQFFSDFFASAVRSARAGSNLNDVYFAFLNISADLKKYVVDDLARAINGAPALTFVFPREIFRTSQDLELTTRELRLVRAATNLLSAAGEVSANALRIGGNLVTRELVWDDARDDIDYPALTSALNTGFMLVLDEEANAKLYRETLSGQLGGVDELLADLAMPTCAPTTLTGCLRSDFGAHYRALIGELKTAVDAGVTANTPTTLSKFELGNFTCSDAFPNVTGSCASIGATVAGTNGDFTFPTAPTNMPYVANFGALAFTSRLRAPLLQADAPFVVKTLPNGAKRIDVSTTFFDTLEQHIMENAGMRVRSAGNPNVFVSGDLTPKPHGLTGDENELLRAVVRPALERAADCPLSRVEYLISL
jgi:acetoacetate decarboxylase